MAVIDISWAAKTQTLIYRFCEIFRVRERKRGTLVLFFYDRLQNQSLLQIIKHIYISIHKKDNSICFPKEENMCTIFFFGQ